MRTLVLIAVAAVIGVGFLLYMMTYTVSFSQAAVVTTFGEAGDSGIVKDEGLHFKWPTPVQGVTVYDTRARLMKLAGETQQTADDRQIIVEAYMTWQVEDPLAFYKSFRVAASDADQHYEEAEAKLKSFLRSAMSAVGGYELNELFSPEVGSSRLPELEQDMFTQMAGADGVTQFGIRVSSVGINRVLLPENTTTQVFARMNAAREKKASEIESEGEAAATAIRSRAEAAARTIRKFAENYAEEIRGKGREEAAQWLSVQSEDPELAVFVRLIDFLRSDFGKRVTLVLPTSMPGLELFDAAVQRQLSEGEIPELLEGITTTETAANKPGAEPRRVAGGESK